MEVFVRMEKLPEGYYLARCINFPAVMAFAKTKRVALKKIDSAMRGYLEAFPSKGELPSDNIYITISV